MSILDVAAAPAVKGSSGPTIYKPLRDTVTDDGLQMQLVARVGDDERFLLVTRETHPTAPLVDRINARNVRRAEIDAALKDAETVLADHASALPTDDDDDETRAALLAALPPEAVNALAERDALTAERKSLPRIDTDRAARVARALMIYSAQDEQ